jgi:hypothetical protein
MTTGLRGNTVFTRADSGAAERPVAFLARSNGDQIVMSGSMRYNPSTDTLTATEFSGGASGLSDVPVASLTGAIQNNQLANDGVTIGSSTCQLGESLSSVAGLISMGATAVSCSILGCTTINCTTVNGVAVNGNGSGVTNVTAAIYNGDIPNSQLVNDGVTVGSTEVKLGESLSSLADLISVGATLVNCTTLGCTTVNCITVNAVAVNGDGSGLSNVTAAIYNGDIPNSQLVNDGVTVGSTEVKLGGSVSAISGLTSIASTTLDTATINGTNNVVTVTSKLGIGTTTPTEKLHIYDPGNAGVVLASSTTSEWLLSSLSTTRVGNFEIQNTLGADRIAFTISPLAASDTVHITSTGLSINTASTGNKALNVVGDGQFTGSVNASSFSGNGAGLTNVNAASYSGSGAGLTNIPVDQFSATIANDKLSNSAISIGNTTVALGATTSSLSGLTSVSAAQFSGGGSGITGVTASDYAGEIPNTQLTNSSITLGTTVCALGSTTLSLNDLSSVYVSDFVTTGNFLTGGGVTLEDGGADDTKYSSNNGGLSSNWGIGLRCSADNTTRHVFDTQTGNSSQLGLCTAGSFSGVGSALSNVRATQITMTSASGNSNFPVMLNTASFELGKASLTFNPTTQTLNAQVFNGNATGLDLGTFTSPKGFVFASGSLPGGNDVFGAPVSDLCYDSTNKRLGVNKSAPTKPLDVIGAGFFAGFNIDVGINHYAGSTNGASFVTCRYNGNQIGDIRQASNLSVSYNQTSDYRLKEKVIEMPSMLQRIGELRPVQFHYLDDDHDSLGFLAHEFQEVFPNAAIVSGTKDAEAMTCSDCYEIHDRCECKGQTCTMKPVHQAMDYGKVTPILTKAIQELTTMVFELSARLSELEK